MKILQYSFIFHKVFSTTPDYVIIIFIKKSIIGFASSALNSWSRLLKIDKRNVCVICLCLSLTVQNIEVYYFCKSIIEYLRMYASFVYIRVILTNYQGIFVFFRVFLQNFYAVPSLHNALLRSIVCILIVCLVLIFFSLQTKKYDTNDYSCSKSKKENSSRTGTLLQLFARKVL